MIAEYFRLVLVKQVYSSNTLAHRFPSLRFYHHKLALPGLLSPNVAKILVEKFDSKPIGTVKDDIADMMGGK